MSQSTALPLLRHVWENRHTTAWEACNHSMSLALRLAIGAQLRFEASDFGYMEKNMRTHYWLGVDGWEYPYALAVEVDNRSCIMALEEYLKREPFFANGIEYRRYGGASEFKHGSRGVARGRLALGFMIGSHLMRVTTVANDHVVVCEYETSSEKLIKRHKWTRADLLELFPPPPKKAKKPKEGGDQ